ncbi:hypothetical protein BKA66DRAFT_446030 [Pyrenochaeta sp. MPI-SDFR-AT-0127]|nr:hypothetical protein BKA66DRAFT_446030 [Pyrenochaeta sp. MPI-SDFR-AT-0127]
MAPLSYDRLLLRLETLFDAVPGQYPGAENAQRVKDVQRAIKAGSIAAQAGLEGDDSVLSPGQLKHWVISKMDDINEQFDRELAIANTTTVTEPATATNPVEIKNTSAVTKRRIYNPNATGTRVKKPVSKHSARGKVDRHHSDAEFAAIKDYIEQREAAETLLDIYYSTPRNVSHPIGANSAAMAPAMPTSSTPVNSTPTSNTSFECTHTTIDGNQQAPKNYQGPLLKFSKMLWSNQPVHISTRPSSFIQDVHPSNNPRLTPLPNIEANAGPEHHFLAGVHYTVQCLRSDYEHAGNIHEFLNTFPGYVQSQLSINDGDEPTDEHSERSTASGTSGQRGDQYEGRNPLRRGFWDVI